MKKLFLPLVIYTLFFAGCANLVDDEISFSGNQTAASEKLINVTGELNFCGAIPSQMVDLLNSVPSENGAKAAIPTVPTGSQYYVIATKTGEAPIQKVATYNSTSKKYEFSLGLTAGTWTIEAVLKNDDTFLLKDSITKTLAEGDSVVTLSFFLKPLKSGTGNIELTFGCDSSVVSSMKFKAFADAEVKRGDTKIDPNSGFYTISNFGTSLSIKITDVPCGVYDVTFNFYKDSLLVYSTTQTINVFANMTTNKWASGTSDGPIDSDGNFKITSALTSNFARSTFYVDGSAIGNDTNGTGSPYKPYKTLTKAVQTVNSKSSGGPFTIYVKSYDSPESVNSSIQINKNMNILVYTNTPGDGVGKYTLNRSSAFNDAVISVDIEKEVVISGIKIDGGGTEYSKDDSSGIRNKGILTLNNCEITNCVAIRSGAGIMASGTRLTLNNTNIYGNESTTGGGGIYINSGIVDFVSGCIGKNDATETATASNYSNKACIGGGVYVYSGCTFNVGENASIKYNLCSTSVDNKGSAIANVGGTVNIEGEISYNYSEDSSAAAISNARYDSGGGYLTFNNAKIHHNKQATEQYSKIEHSGTSLTVKGSTWIDENSVIFLSSSNLVYVEGNLTPKNVAGVAQDYTSYISVSSPDIWQTVLRASSAEIIENNCNKFAIRSGTGSYGVVQGSGSEDEKKTGVICAMYFVGGTGASDSNNGSKNKPFATLQKAISTMDTDSGIIYIMGNVLANTSDADNNASITTIGNQTIKILKYPGIDTTPTIKAATDKSVLTIDNSQATVIIQDINFSNGNITEFTTNGGALNVKNVKVCTLQNVTISGFSLLSGYSGGGIYVQDGAGTVKLVDCNIQNCSASISGGAIYIKSGTGKVSLTGNTIIGAVKDSSGNAITSCAGNTATTRSNLAASGGGIFVGTGAELYVGSDAIISYNTSTEYGSAIHNEGGKVTIEGTVCYNYSDNTEGVAIYNNTAELTFNNAKIYKNGYKSPGNPRTGGGVYHSGNSLTIKGSTWFDEDSVIRLGIDTIIKVEGTLSPENNAGVAQDYTAHVYLSSITSGSTAILEADSADDIKNNCEKFDVNAGGYGITQGTTDETNKKGYATKIYYVDASAVSGTRNGTKAKPYETLEAATSKLVDSEAYIIYIRGEVLNNTLATIDKSATVLITKDPNYNGTATIKRSTNESSPMIKIENSDAKITIKDVTIDGDRKSIANNGAGLFLLNVKECTLQNVEIKNCFTTLRGGGIYLAINTSVSLEGTTSITACNASVGGSGIYASTASSHIYLKDSVFLDANSDIRLNTEGYVTLKGNLTPSAADGIVATLTPAAYFDDYDEPYRIVQEESTGLVASNYSKFKVTPDSNGNKYKIGSNGKIKKLTAQERVATATEHTSITLSTTDDLNDFADALKAKCTSDPTVTFDLNMSALSGSTLTSRLFENCTNIISITFPNSSFIIEQGAFLGCTGVEAIYFEDGRTTEKAVYGQFREMDTGNPTSEMIQYLFNISVFSTYLTETINENDKDCGLYISY